MINILLTLIVLKLVGVIDWHWTIVFAPLWIQIGLSVGALLWVWLDPRLQEWDY